MTHAVRGFGLAATLLLVSTFAVVTQSGAQSTAAYVYVQVGGPAGAVYGYSASSSGQLSAIPGPPFKPGTAIVGGNGSQFFTLGNQKLHSYGVSFDGTIGAQISQYPLLDFAGHTCGSGTSGGDAAVLNHFGHIYVLLQNGSGDCAAYQSYAIDEAGFFVAGPTAEITWTPEENGSYYGFTLPASPGSVGFAYSSYDYLDSGPVVAGFQIGGGGLEPMQFHETDPTLNNGRYSSGHPDASPINNYVVLQLLPNDSLPIQLGSYTVDLSGNISTTNTSSNMPTSAFSNPSTTFSPSENLFVAYADGANPGINGNSGIEIYNFNGAAPLTLYKTLLTGTPIDGAAWDGSNHLYAFSKSQNKLWVFTVTPTSVTEDASYSIGSPFSIVVAPSTGGACSAPTSDGVNVCLPAEGATVTSPVQINAATTVSGGAYRFELWSGNSKLLSEDNGTMDQTVYLAPGNYKLTFDAYNSSKSSHEYATRDITVK
jgi:hypothetical protein